MPSKIEELHGTNTSNKKKTCLMFNKCHCLTRTRYQHMSLHSIISFFSITIISVDVSMSGSCPISEQ